MGRTVTEKIHPIVELLQQDQRYHIEAYQFVREALSYAQEILKMPAPTRKAKGKAPEAVASEVESEEDLDEAEYVENHITGQQLCEAIRLFSLEQYGFMASTVLNNWGIHCTGDFGEIVYNLIRIKHMKKSDSDRREDFDDVYDFANAFEPVFEHTTADEA